MNELVKEFIDSLSPKLLKYYSIRDNCGPACLDMMSWSKNIKDLELTRVRGYFIGDELLTDKADFTKEMKNELLSKGLDFNNVNDRKEFLQNDERYSSEWKNIPHYWLEDTNGNVYDPVGYHQIILGGLSKDLDINRYIKEQSLKPTVIIK